jgi:hypothetical protein
LSPHLSFQEDEVLANVFPIKLKDGNQAKAEELVLGQFAGRIVEFVEIDHELLVGV